jgi:hypothetical protein
MPTRSKRDDFTSATVGALAKRSAFLCAICKVITVGPSTESPRAVSNIGVASHITAAAPGGPRYDASLTSAARSDIMNGIWLCQIHAKLIDDDCMEWTEAKLRETKKRHEDQVKSMIGIPRRAHTRIIDAGEGPEANSIKIREFAFLQVRALVTPYRSVLRPMLLDCGLTGNTELGFLMCEAVSEGDGRRHRKVPWTVFVKAGWLRWFLEGQSLGYKTVKQVPPEQIYGVMPGWPDSFFELLQAIVETNTTLEWRRGRT